MKENINLAKDLKIIELCSGIGAQVKGVKNTKLFNPNVVATADLDKEVVVSYAAIHCGLTKEMIEGYEEYPSKEQMIKELSDKRLGYDFKKDKPYNWQRLAKKKDKTKGIEKYWLADKISRNLGDVTKIQEIPDCDLLTYSMPCTDMSIAGKQEGLKWTCQNCGTEYDPSKLEVETRYNCPNCNNQNVKSTRSGLLYEVERLLVKAKENNNLPTYLLMENVDALVSKKYIDSFNDWIDRLDGLGYNSYHQTINAKNCGIPQNRNRIFCVSILKDVDTGKFTFPKPFDLGLRLKDFLEDEVDEKYYLSDEIQKRLQITDSLKTNEPIHIADLCSEKFQRMHEQSRRIYGGNGMHTCGGGNIEPKVLIDNQVKQNHTELPCILDDRDKGFGVKTSDICPCQRAERSGIKVIKRDFSVRKLTPKEAHRFMRFDDQDYEKCKAVGMSDSQGYKQSGNSIVVNVIALLMEHLYKAQYDNSYICSDENFTRPTTGLNSACGETNRIIVVGNTVPSGHTAGRICDIKGISPTVMYRNSKVVQIVVGAAIRGRYNTDGKTEQQIEIRDDEISNCITTVQKDSLVIEKRNKPMND